jgi:hypothetical protein
MRAKSLIQAGLLSSILVSIAGVGSVQAQVRPSTQTVSIQVPSVVKIVADPTAVGPTGLPRFRVVTNDPAIRRRLEQGAEGGLVAEALVAELSGGRESAADYRFTVVAP